MDSSKIYSDEQLLVLSSEGNRDAEEHLIIRYLNLVKSCSHRLYLLGGDSEDLIQEGTLGLLSAIRTYNPAIGPFSTYAEHCIKMRMFSAIKSASSLKNNPINNGLSFEQLSEDAEISDNLKSSIRITEDLILSKEKSEEFAAKVSDLLSSYEKRVLSLYLDGNSYDEIAFMLGKNTKSVDNAIQRIRQKLARNN